MSIESVVTDVREPSLLGMDFNGLLLHGHLEYTIDPTRKGASLRQREIVHLRWPLRWFAGRVERRLRGQLARRLAEVRDMLEAEAERRPE